ncbi:MAG TPA: hypothetical protein VKT81_23735 [Bryobacteraceae bacterium]|nr:hypothetical protein [Bryobacteraceae bacterium]
MRLACYLRTGILLAGMVFASSVLLAQKPDAAAESDAKEAQSSALGMPPRTAATEYLTHTQVGQYLLGAEFMGHSVPTPQSTYSSEDFVIVEVGFFGQPGARLRIAANDFSLRINGKKSPLASQPYELAFHSLKDPEWEPPALEKSKTSLNTGGGGSQNDQPPPPPKMPLELRRAMEQRVQKAALPEGDRALPQAGFLFFEYRGKTQGIKSLELIYEGAAGKVTLALQP